MSSQLTFAGITSATSSPASGFGPMRSGAQDGPTTAPHGLVHAHVSPSPSPAPSAAPLTSAISGPSSSGSSASVALQRSLASRLRDRLPLPGLTLFRLTWKERVTPSGRPICALRASALRTSDSACTGWATPAGHEAGGTPEQFLERKRKAVENGSELGVSLTSLSLQAQLASWPTPQREDSESTGAHHGTPDTLHSASQLAGWSTPRANKWGFPDAHGSHEAPSRIDGTINGGVLLIPVASSMESWEAQAVAAQAQLLKEVEQDAT